MLGVEINENSDKMMAYLKLHADKRRMQQILSILPAKGSKFTPPGW